MLASIVGFYSLPLFRRLKPELHDTPMTKIIGNVAVILILSSALPVLARTLGECACVTHWVAPHVGCLLASQIGVSAHVSHTMRGR